jgi:hypothetical protein
MKKPRLTLHAKSEAELAAQQVCQVGNTCSFHAIAVGLRMLLGVEVNPMALSAEVDNLWRRLRFMRVAPGWAVTPRQQVRIVRHLARTRGFPVTAKYQHGDPETLPNLLDDPDSVPLITLVWLWKGASPIYLGDTDRHFNVSKKPGGHTMILGAYNPDHSAAGKFPTPWGFINPWTNGGAHLFWMRDADFRKAWRFPLPLVRPNALVVMSKKREWGIVKGEKGMRQ